VLIELAQGSECAAVFTRNSFCAAPVIVARNHLDQCGGQPRYLLINTGNANAGTGEPGLRDAQACAAAVAATAGVDTAQVLPFSTGVIGEPLPVDPIKSAVPAAVAGLVESGWADAASGILTTDTRPKGLSQQFSCEDQTFTVTGIAKGAGMLRPDMATMLAYLGTDMAVEPRLLQRMLAGAVAVSFNRISVDGDTSTNDACVLVATGAAGNRLLDSPRGPLYDGLRDALESVCIALAQGLVRDGEGASKFVTVQVNGGRDEAECLQVAYTIAHSPLVKTALFASDPNWGRLLAAIGRAGLADLEVERVALYLNELLIAENGCRATDYSEARGVEAMAPEAITIRVELHRGEASARIWTTDFSYDYVRINAEYRT
jgi:glutamate N-acetyltransferase/amino-acid N-acetyltransferase